VEGVLVRVAATGALERSREMALVYARRARESLDGEARRDELEALADIVVDRSA
jgi:geranylgeranyl pyrophosphate synthase